MRPGPIYVAEHFVNNVPSIITSKNIPVKPKSNIGKYLIMGGIASGLLCFINIARKRFKKDKRKSKLY